MKRLRLTPEAELDVDEALLWYHRQSPRVAADCLASVNACLASIRHQPDAYALIDASTRRALVRRFPYAVFYEVTPAAIGVFGGPPPHPDLWILLLTAFGGWLAVAGFVLTALSIFARDERRYLVLRAQGTVILAVAAVAAGVVWVLFAPPEWRSGVIVGLVTGLPFAIVAWRYWQHYRSVVRRT